MPKKNLRILFSSVGRRVELVQCFRSDAQALGLNLFVIGADANPLMSAACRAADDFAPVPRCLDSQYIPALLDLCKSRSIDLLIPTIDTELGAISKHRADFNRLGTRVAISGPELITICRDKLKTADLLRRSGIGIPQTLPLREFQDHPEAIRFPIILKPIDGSSSIGIFRFNSFEAFRAASLPPFNYMVQELWAGSEYTVNMFFDSNHSLRSIVPHLRYEVRAGEVSKGITEDNPLLIEAGRSLAKSLPQPFGPLCFQAILREDSQLAIFEINARFGGGYPLAWRAGATFSKWLLEWAADLPPTIHPNWEDRLTMLRYDAAIFLPAAKFKE